MKNRAFDESKYPNWIDPAEVKPYERNAKLHPPEQIKAIVDSIKRFGWQQDTVITADNVLVIGHGRRLAALEIGCKLPYHRVGKNADELTDDEIKALRLADNLTAVSGYDQLKLDLELEELRDFGMEDFGFEMTAGEFVAVAPEPARKIEVGVPSPQERLDAMREYNKLSKGGTTLRLRPFILGVTDKTYIDLIYAAHDAGASAVTTEFFCLEMRSIKLAAEHYRTISDVCGFDIVEFYRKHSTGSGYLRLNRKIKEPFVRKMQEVCRELGMRFYVSDSHFKELSNNACCCALPPEWEYSRGNFSAALQIAKKHGEVHWRDIAQDMDFLDTFEWGRAQGYNCNSVETRAKYDGLTMKGYLRYLWNNPKRGQSPYKIFGGVLIPDGYDEDQNIIYKYNDGVTHEKHKNEEWNLDEI